MARVRAHLGERYHYVVQEQPLGTGRRGAPAVASLRRFPRQSADPLRRHAAVPPGLDSRPAQPARSASRRTSRCSPRCSTTPCPTAASSAMPAARSSTSSKTPRLARSARDPRAERGRLCRRRAGDLRRARTPLAVAARWRVPPDRLRARADPLRPARGELPASTIRTKCRASTPPRTWRRPSSSCRSASSVRAAQEEQNLVTFGTGGWRAIIGEGFTMHNVRRLSQALANEITRRGQEKQRRDHRLRPPLSLAPGRRSRRRSFRRQQHPHHAARRRRAHAADHLRHGDSRLRLRPGLYRQPQSAGMERPQSFSRRWLAAARPRNPPDRSRDQRAHSRTT